MVRVRLMPWESSPPPLAELCLLTLARHVDRLGDLGDLPDDLVETLLVGTCARLCAKVATEKTPEGVVVPRRARDELARSETAAWCGRGASPRGSPSRWATRVAFDAADLERVERETKRRSGRTLDARALAPAWAALLKRDFPTSATNANANPNPNPSPGDDESRPRENNRRRAEDDPLDDARADDPLDDARATYLARAARERGRVASARAALARAYADERDAKRRGAVARVNLAPPAAKRRATSLATSLATSRLANDARTRGRGGRGVFVPPRPAPSAPRGSSGSSSQSGVGSSSRDRLASRLGMGAGFRGRGGSRAAVESARVVRRVDRATGASATTRRFAGGRVVTTIATPAAAVRARNRPAARLVEEAEL
jgi:hypothetical protein